MPTKDYEQIITILTREILKKRLAIFVGAGCAMAVRKTERKFKFQIRTFWNSGGISLTVSVKFMITVR